MWKIVKSKKALSPVVAAIILIAVTVAVSIAVAAWMGALTFTFMKTEELKIISHTWSAGQIELKVRNTGTSALTITGAEVNGASASSDITNTPLDPNTERTVTITQTFTSGQKYEFAIKTSAGNKYTYIATAP